MDDMRNEYEAMKLVPKVTLKEMFINATLRIPLIIAMMIMVAQQLSGINAVSVSTCQLLHALGLISTVG
jgi:SP family facilitated glucose transporter-like MFS transporter 1